MNLSKNWLNWTIPVKTPIYPQTKYDAPFRISGWAIFQTTSSVSLFWLMDSTLVSSASWKSPMCKGTPSRFAPTVDLPSIWYNYPRYPQITKTFTRVFLRRFVLLFWSLACICIPCPVSMMNVDKGKPLIFGYFWVLMVFLRSKSPVLNLLNLLIFKGKDWG